MHTPDTTERRGDFRAPASRCGERAGECRLHALDLDLSHQTVAVRPETACGFGGDWPVRSSCLSESGSTTEPRSGSGAEGGQACAVDVDVDVDNARN